MPITLHLLTYGDTVRSVIGLVNTVHLAHRSPGPLLLTSEVESQKLGDRLGDYVTFCLGSPGHSEG